MSVPLNFTGVRGRRRLVSLRFSNEKIKGKTFIREMYKMFSNYWFKVRGIVSLNKHLYAAINNITFKCKGIIASNGISQAVSLDYRFRVAKEGL